MNAPRKSMLVFVLFVIVFFSFSLLACDDGPSCGNLPGDTPCTEQQPRPENIIMGERNPIEQVVDGLVCGDGTCDNTLSGGQP